MRSGNDWTLATTHTLWEKYGPAGSWGLWSLFTRDHYCEGGSKETYICIANNKITLMF